MVFRAGRCHHSAACVQETDLDTGHAVSLVIDTVVVTIAPDCAAHPSVGRSRVPAWYPPTNPAFRVCRESSPSANATVPPIGRASLPEPGGGAGVAIRHEEFYAGVAAGGEG